MLDRIEGFIISVTQDSGNQRICIESSDEDTSNPSVYIDFIKNTVQAEQDGMRISEQTLPQNYKDAITASELLGNKFPSFLTVARNFSCLTG